MPSVFSKMKKKWIVPPNKCLWRDEVNRVLEFAEERKDLSRTTMTQFMFVTLGFNTGLRISELCELRHRNFMLIPDNSEVMGIYPSMMVESGKTTSARRVIPLNNKAVEAIFIYMKAKLSWREGIDNDDYFFISPRTGSRYSRSGMYKSFMKLMKQIPCLEYKKLSPHSMRHSYACEVHRKSKNRELLKDLLGHSSIQTGSVYITLADHEKVGVVENLYKE